MAIVAQTSNLGKIFWPALAWLISIIFFFPIFWMVLTSFKTDADAVKPEFLIFFKPTLENYFNMTDNYDYWRFAINSTITSIFATLFSLFVGVPASYVMAFNPTKNTKNILIWMLFTYFKEIPKEIIEASRMDGVNTWGELKEIIIPLAWGGLASTALLCFIFCWNEAYWTVRLTTNEAATLSKLIEGNRAPEGLFFGRLSAVSSAAVAPIVILGWFCQRQLVKGLTFGAVK